MTCIVGLEHDGKVTLAADQMGSNRVSYTIRRDEKLVKVSEQLVLAFTGSYRQGQLLRWQLKGELPDLGFVDSIGGAVDGHDRREEWMNTAFIDAVRKVLEKGGARAKDKEVEEGSTFLAAFGDRLWMVECDNQVASTVAGWDTNGSGWGPAAGALAATEGFDITPEERLELAVRAACATVPSVGLGPDDVVPMMSTKGIEA